MKGIRRILWIIIVVLILMLFLKPKENKKVLEDGFYENCYMISLKESRMHVVVEGENITIECHIEGNGEKKDKIADIQVENNKVVKVTWKEGLVADKVDSLHLAEGWINLSTYGKKKISQKGEMYIKTGEEVRRLLKAGSLLNRDKVLCYIYRDEICAVIVEGEENLTSVRVLLHGEIENVFHETVKLTGTMPYRVIIDGEEKEYPAGKEVSFSKDMGLARVHCPEGKIKILSMKRASGYPQYRGEILIYSYEEGFLIRNELKLEEYLYSVVSSEMPSSYPEEALKAQAVCARTYAIYQMEQAYYGEYGAHVDDTVNSQVYNNVAETESTIHAVKETKGQYLSYENAPICAYFYSTSCGMTSDVEDVWIGESENDTPVYLTGRFQGMPDKALNLSEEAVFYEFITKNQPDCFEKEENWFRWNGKLDYAKLSEHVQSNMNLWIKNSPSLYQLICEGETLGIITKVQVEGRSKGGVIKKISLIGEKGTLTVAGEYQIRNVLCPEGTEVTLQDGSQKVCTMLPSGYFAIDNEDQLVLTGGGYGHGVGMSQNGAGAMAGLGKKYEEILSFYYPETVLLEAY